MEQTASLLSALDPDFPRVTLSEVDLFVRNDCLGEGYARFTEKACKAARLVKTQTGILLNGTYTAKAFAALLDDAERGELRDKTVLFWNTYNSRDLSACVSGVDYPILPKPFHRYFEKDVQPLDREGSDL
jgi:D-cysteine desulfhydrase